MELGGITMQGTFKVFNSGGEWLFLFSKPMLRKFKACHDYKDDTILIKNTPLVLTNQIDALYYVKLVKGRTLTTTDWKQYAPRPAQNPALNKDSPTQIATMSPATAKPDEPSGDWVEIPTEALTTEGDMPSQQTDPFSVRQV
jgi:hypothetical protein